MKLSALARSLGLPCRVQPEVPDDIRRVEVFSPESSPVRAGTLYLLPAGSSEPGVLSGVCVVVPEKEALHVPDCSCLLAPDELPPERLRHPIRTLLAEEEEYTLASLRLREAMVRGMKLQEFINLCAEITGNDVVFSGKDTQLIARSSGEADSSLWREHSDLGHFSESTRNLESYQQLHLDIEKSTGPELYVKRVTRHSTVTEKVVLNGVQIGVVSIIDTCRPVGEREKRLLSLITPLLVHYITPETFTSDHLSQHRIRLIRSILSGLPDRDFSTESAEETLHLQSWYRILLIRPEPGDGGATPLSSVIPHLRKLLPEHIVVHLQEHIVVVLPEEAGEIWFRRVELFAPFLEQHRLYMGVSRPGIQLSSFRACFLQAQKALELGTLLTSRQRLFDYESFICEHLWQTLSTSVNLRDYCHPAACQLRQMDRDTGSDYVSTLECLFDSNGNQTVAAQKLGIHKSTLRYRLEKIEGLVPLDLSDSRECLDLQIAFQILRLLDAMGQ